MPPAPPDSPPATAPPVTTVPSTQGTKADLIVMSGATGATTVTPGSTFRPTIKLANQGGTDVATSTVVGVAVTLDDVDLDNPEAWSDSQLGLASGKSVSVSANGGPNGGLVTAPATLGDHTLAFKSQPNQLVDTINGVNDASFRAVATQLVASGFPDAVLRLGWEYDGDWMPWAAPGKETNLIAAFRHVHDVFQSVSTRFRYDFNGTTGVDGWKTTWAKCYPGDAYVDIIGGDAYAPWPRRAVEAARSAEGPT